MMFVSTLDQTSDVNYMYNVPFSECHTFVFQSFVPIATFMCYVLFAVWYEEFNSDEESMHGVVRERV